MKIKLLAILVFVMVTSMSIAGCTFPTTSSPTPTPTPQLIASTETSTDNNTTFSSAAGFNITYPTTLRADSTTNASVQVRIYIYLAPFNTVNAVDVATEAVLPNVTSADYAKDNVNLISNYSNYTLISNQSTTLGGKPAYTVVWQATVPVQVGSNASNIQNQTLKVMQTYLVNNNTGYVITYKAISGDYNTYLAQAQQVMNSFEFNSRSSS